MLGVRFLKAMDGSRRADVRNVPAVLLAVVSPQILEARVGCVGSAGSAKIVGVEGVAAEILNSR